MRLCKWGGCDRTSHYQQFRTFVGRDGTRQRATIFDNALSFVAALRDNEDNGGPRRAPLSLSQGIVALSFSEKKFCTPAASSSEGFRRSKPQVRDPIYRTLPDYVFHLTECPIPCGVYRRSVRIRLML